MKKLIIFVILSVAGLIACNRNAPDNNEQSTQSQANMPAPGSKVGKMEDQVMALHEKTMNDLDSVMALKKDLKALAGKEGLSKTDNDSIDANLHRLQKADDEMMDWMNNYQEPDKMMAEDKAMAYLNGQLSKIQEIYAEMQRSIAEANNYLKSEK